MFSAGLICLQPLNTQCQTHRCSSCSGRAGGLRGRYRELPPTAAELQGQQRQSEQQPPQQQKQQRSPEMRAKQQTRFAEPADGVTSDDAYDRPVRSKGFGCFACFG